MPLKAKTDKRLFAMIIAFQLIVSAILIVLSMLIFNSYFIIVPAAAVLILSAIYVVLYLNSIEYHLFENRLEKSSGLIFRKKHILYLKETATVARYCLPYNTGFSVIKVQGTTTIVLSMEVTNFITVNYRYS